MPSKIERPTDLILLAGNKNPNAPLSGSSNTYTHLMPISPEILFQKIKQDTYKENQSFSTSLMEDLRQDNRFSSFAEDCL